MLIIKFFNLFKIWCSTVAASTQAHASSIHYQLMFSVGKNEVFNGKDWKNLKDFPINGGPKATFVPGYDDIVYIAGGIINGDFLGPNQNENILLNTIWEFNLQTNEVKEIDQKIPLGM